MLVMSKRILLVLTLFILSVSSSYVNIAYKRPAWQKTTHPSNFGPEKAVDGLKSDLSANGHQCSISKNKQRIASWRVNLLGIKFIHHVVIYYRTDNKIWDENNSLRGRFLGFSVYISNTENKDDGRLCFHDTKYNMTTIPAVVNITCEIYGQYVIYYNERNADTLYPPGYSTFAYNELCEVEVYDCASGTFGANCTRQCGHCAGYCDHRYGNCSGGCTPGFKGIMCNEVCELGKFGENCYQSCGMCKGECMHVNGMCSGGCQPGYEGDFCEKVNLAYNQPTWQKASHPADFGPEKAVDGLKSDLSARGHQCTVSADTERVAIWRVKLAMYSFIRNVVIYYRTNNIEWGENNAFAGRFLGFSIYISDSESKENGTLCFHDTENNRTTIPAVVNITCELYGQYVIYYNERSADTVYPPGYSTYAYNELCELEVYGCPLGYYGPNCSQPCPTHCEKCNIETGDCVWCDLGYSGENCDFPCSLGTFGSNCTSECGECVGYCDQRYGNCSECKAGFTGIRCNEVCEEGMFGKNCNQSCGMCKGECFHINGTCTRGCQSGYQGEMCNEECHPGQYGADCKEYCGECKGKCHHEDGRCSDGCKSGYRGLTCKTECNPGTYGSNCTSECGECLGHCNPVNGHCLKGCNAGFIGIKCNKECAFGRYGVNCSGLCGECLGECNNVDGCAGRCKAGYNGVDCLKVCQFGFFGVNCQHECSTFCSTSRNCSRISGFCHGGCKQGWEGVDCLEIRDYKVSRILGWTETVAVLSISLSVNLCVLLAYCKRRYAGPQKRRKLNISRYNSSRNFLSEEAQTDPIGLDDQEYGRREYNELQLLNGENHYWNM